jgi:tetratricopeptide (TPR) repeat protein
MLLLLSVALVSTTKNVEALSAKDLRGACKTDFQKWKKLGGYGAFALSKNGYCGYTWDNESPEMARNGALSRCGAGGKGKSCTIISRNGTASAHLLRVLQCGKPEGQKSIDACTAIVASKHVTGTALAWTYTERANRHEELGRLDDAISDFTSAIKAKKSYSWAYFNRGMIYFGRGELVAAQSDLETSLKLYKSGKGPQDFRNTAKSSLANIKTRVDTVRKYDAVSLCKQAIKGDRSDWDTLTSTQLAVKEAKRRKLTVETCRMTLEKQIEAELQTKDDMAICSVAFDSATGAWSSEASRKLQVAEAVRRKLEMPTCTSLLKGGN